MRAAAPQTIKWGRRLCSGLRGVAYKQHKFGNRDEALQSRQRLVAVGRKLVFENPAVALLKAELYRDLMTLGANQRDHEQLACKDQRIVDAEKLDGGVWAVPQAAVRRILAEGIPPERRNKGG